MKKLLIFGGTTEGRLLADFCDRHDLPAELSVATAYGSEVLPGYRSVRILQGRKNAEEMKALLTSGGFGLVLDATHPHAAEVSREIRSACGETGTELVRVLRAEDAPEARTELAGRDLLFRAADAAEAASIAASLPGGIFLTTGSKELSAFSALPKERLFARVLPSAEALEACREAGIPSAHISAMQGPFTAEMNEAMLRQTGCRILVTKDSGIRGGFREKMEACRRTGAAAVVIGRPETEEGMTLAETFQLLRERYALSGPEKIVICGIGPGSAGCMTGEVREEILRAELLAGAARMVEAAQAVRRDAGFPPAEQAVTWKAAEIADLPAAHPGKRITVLMSGDSGFFSGTAGVRAELGKRGFRKVRVLPGISSLSFLAASCGLPWERIVPLSLHGRNADCSAVLRRCGAVFLTLSDGKQLSEIAASLTAEGLGRTRICAGRALSLPEERIWSFLAEEIAAEETTAPGGDTAPEKNNAAEALPAADDGRKLPVCAILTAPEGARPLSPGIPDSAFFREDRVPLTKEELRAVIISKLRPRFDSVCWDIGSGTGGVTAELAMAAPAGKVLAVECDPAAFRVTRENIRRFGLLNVTQVSGSAPDCLADLPAPDCAFIGGAHGQTEAILERIFAENPAASAAVTAVTLETAAELFRLLKRYETAGYETECVQIAVSRARKAGTMSLLTAQNPVFLCVIRGKTEASRGRAEA